MASHSATPSSIDMTRESKILHRISTSVNGRGWRGIRRATTRPRRIRRRRGRRWRARWRRRSASSARGFTGLSAALELAERGHEVVVLEAAQVGWGASGRNGGQIVNGLNAEPRDDRAALRAGDGGLRRQRGAGGRADHPRAGGALRHRLRPEGRQPLRGLHGEADARARGEAGAVAAARARQLRAARPGGRAAARRRATPMPAGCSTGAAGTCIR